MKLSSILLSLLFILGFMLIGLGADLNYDSICMTGAACAIISSGYFELISSWPEITLYS